MKMYKSFIAVICLLGLTNCVPLIAFTGYKAVTTLAEERGTNAVAADTVIITKIKNAFVQRNFDHLFSSLSVYSNEGRVLLTGTVEKQQYVIDAVRVAWSIKGVKEVINEISVGKKSAAVRASDVMIGTKVRTKILLNEDIKSLNYTVDVNEGVVYIIGIAQNQVELDSVLEMASSVADVKKVVSHVTFKKDPRRSNSL